MRAAHLVVAGAVGLASVSAAAAPADLLNKSVTVSYTITIPAKGQDGSVVPGVRNATRTFYISGKGRIFARVTRQDGRMSATKEAAPGEPANNVRFDGNRMVGVMPFISGAAQMTVSFGQGGQSCSAAIIIGRSNGRTLSWKGVNGMTYQATGEPAVSNVSCAISAGNAFAE